MLIVTRSIGSIREDLNDLGKVDKNFTVSRGIKGVVVGSMNKALGSDARRYAVMGWLFHYGRPVQSSVLSNWMWQALYKWISPYKENNVWKTDPMFPAECVKVLHKAYEDFGFERDELDEQIDAFAEWTYDEEDETKGAQNGRQDETRPD